MGLVVKAQVGFVVEEGERHICQNGLDFFLSFGHSSLEPIKGFMELRHLRYFVAVAEELSFTRAAARLHLAQPSLTRQIKDLEAEIGVRLVDRSGKRICLTEEGKSFLADTKRLLADSAENVEAVQRMSRGKTEQLNIGYAANIYHDLLPATLGAFRQACPNAALNLFDMTPAEQYQALDELRIDLGFVGLRAGSIERYRDLPWACFAQDRMMAVIPKKDPLARRPTISLKELESKFFVGLSEKTYPGARAWLVEACRQADFNPRILQEADREPAVIKFVAARLGVALLPQQVQMLPHEGVVFRSIKPRLIAESCVVWRPDNRSNCLEHYVRIVKQLSKS
jgi:DNA-binding transcriptional LysR family regulator